MEERQCPRCKEIKAVAEFHYNRANRTGLSAYCKLCNKALHAEANRKHNAKRVAAKRAHHQLFPEKNRENMKRYAAEMKKNNPAKWRARKFFDAIKTRKDVDANVTRDYIENLFATITHCQCCGNQLTLDYEVRESREYRSNPNSPSIDRVDNNLSYSRNNIGVVCWKCNFRKTDLTLEDLEMFKTYINKHSNVSKM